MSVSASELMMLANGRACMAQLQIQYCTQHVPNLWNGSVWEDEPECYSEATILAGDLSESAWADIDPNQPTSLLCRALANGVLNPQDVGVIKANTAASIQAWVSSREPGSYSAALLGEIEFMAAADNIASFAGQRRQEQPSDLLRDLERRGRDYVQHRNDYLAGIGLT